MPLENSRLFKSPPPPPGKANIKEKKELLIFAIYINIGQTSEAKLNSRLAEFQEIYTRTFNEIESKTNYIIRSFIFPIKEGETRMECVFSGDNTKVSMPNANELLATLEKSEEVKGFTIGEENPHGDRYHDVKTQGMMSDNNVFGRKTSIITKYTSLYD